MTSAALHSLFTRGRDAKPHEPEPDSAAAAESAVTAARQHLAELLQATAGGDQDAFAELYQATSAKLYGLALRIVRDDSTAQECMQDAFIRIWEHAGEYRPNRGAPLTWMGTIVRRRALDRVRRQDRERMLDDPEDLTRKMDQVEHTEGPEEGRSPGEWEALAAALGQLRQEQREALRLAYFEGLSHPEVAVRMGIPLGTVKTWIRRGMEKLRTCLET
ncbi:RNA polymerase sigma factor [Thiohalorhabdus sp.]|uniref:RNA polymerase sigma factor n=1 Tax=Thiohalorhabdus sp. TaxID=3094134 RepID=UPI002FC3A406